MKRNSHLSLEERLQITVLQGKGISVRKIAKELGRSPSTISRELNRENALYYRGTYIGSQTHNRVKEAWLNSSSYKEYKNLAKQKFAENLKNGMDMNQAMDKAKKDALKELGLSENAFNGHWKYAKLLNYFENNDSTYISKSALKKAGEWINKKQAI